MAKQGTATATPRLRFPEFRGGDDWATTELRQFSGFVTERVGATECTPYTVTSGIGLVSQQEKLGRTIAGNSLKNYVVLQRNDFAYNKSATKAFPQGFIARYTGDERAAVPNSIFTCFRTDVEFVDPTYLGNLFSTNLHGAWLRGRIAVGARAHGSLNVSDEDLMDLPVPLPGGVTSLAEQQKIADCLTSLDEVIAGQGRKVEALKAHKRGLMQQLFPREGETRPRLRFPEFRNAPDWKELPLGKLVDLLSGYPFDGTDIAEDSAGERLMRGINITEGIVRHNVEIDRYYIGPTTGLEKFRLEQHDLVIGMDGSKVGRNSAIITESDVDALLVQRVARLRGKSVPLINFIFHQIHSPRFHAYVDRINTSSGIPHISATQIKEYPIHSTTEEEQQRIADCLSALDIQITAEFARLAALKTHKRGLMQRLFPSQAAG